MIETVLGVGRRRAQQIIRPLVKHTIGRNGLAHRDDVILRLRTLSAGDAAFYERRRQQRLRAVLEEARNTPRVLVEAPARVQQQTMDGLPEGVEVSRGQVRVKFDSPREALEKLLALAMAIGNDMVGFERLAG